MPPNEIVIALQLPAARIVGPRWSVAMRDAEWERFSGADFAHARHRLTALMEHFCREGEQNLPRGAFGWMTRPERSGVARQGAFEARGAVLLGHAAGRLFFVTEVRVDAGPARQGRHRRIVGDTQQRQLPLPFIVSKGEQDG